VRQANGVLGPTNWTKTSSRKHRQFVLKPARNVLQRIHVQVLGGQTFCYCEDPDCEIENQRSHKGVWEAQTTYVVDW
jgi:hypothetical protein